MSNTDRNRVGSVVGEDQYSEYEEKYGSDTFEKFSNKKRGSPKPSKGKKPRDSFSREENF